MQCIVSRGGLPPFSLAAASPERDFQEWLDAYRAKDVQELVRLEKRSAFGRLFEVLLVDVGGIIAAGRRCDAPTIARSGGSRRGSAVDDV